MIGSLSITALTSAAIASRSAIGMTGWAEQADQPVDGHAG